MWKIFRLMDLYMKGAIFNRRRKEKYEKSLLEEAVRYECGKRMNKW